MGLAKDFRDFAIRGNMMDLAVGLIIGRLSRRSSNRSSMMSSLQIRYRHCCYALPALHLDHRRKESRQRGNVYD